MKIHRMLEMVILLLRHKTLTAGWLAEHFEVSPRTIYRDVDALCAAGMPLYASRGKGGGIGLMEDFKLDKALLTEQEKNSMLLALQTLKATQYPEVEATLSKLGVLFSQNEPPWVVVDFSPWASSPQRGDTFNTLRQGILQRKVISMSYINASGILSQRNVEPIKLIFKGQAWYLMAFCLLKNEERMFRISRMRQVMLTPITYEMRESQPPPADTNHYIVLHLELAFHKDVLYRLYDNYDPHMIKEAPDGTYRLSLDLPDDDWVYSYLLSFGPNVEVLSPPHIRDILERKLTQTLHYYLKPDMQMS